MMQVDLYHHIFLVSLGLAIIFFLLTVILFFAFDIRKIIGIKTGHIQKKSIADMRRVQSGIIARNTKKSGGQIDLRSDGSEETEKLKADEGMTAVLPQSVNGAAFVVVSEIMEVHAQKITL